MGWARPGANRRRSREMGSARSIPTTVGAWLLSATAQGEVLGEGIREVDTALRGELRVGPSKRQPRELTDIPVQLQNNLTGVLSRDADTYPTNEGGR
jgi:hypothetical protein